MTGRLVASSRVREWSRYAQALYQTRSNTACQVVVSTSTGSELPGEEEQRCWMAVMTPLTGLQVPEVENRRCWMAVMSPTFIGLFEIPDGV